MAAHLYLFARHFSLPFANNYHFDGNFYTATGHGINADIGRLFNGQSFSTFFRDIAQAFFANHTQAMTFTQNRVHRRHDKHNVLRLYNEGIANHRAYNFYRFRGH